MHETWLRPNRRALWFGCIPPLLIAAAGIWLLLRSGGFGGAWGWVGAALLTPAVAALVTIAFQLTRPRIAYRDGTVLFNLRAGAPIGVPVAMVEAFFLGQGQANLPGDYQGQQKTVNLVARLARRRKEWAQRDVRPAFGNWSDSYVTIRGTWCEPLDPQVVRRLNRRLKDVQTLTDPKSDR
jgi:hypothetical protein